MSKHDYNTVIKVLHPVCCGLDVHKKSITACLITTNSNGKIEMEIKEFKTFTSELFNLRDWLKEEKCPVVAMESTGVYWCPVHNILEKDVEVLLVNARHAKNVPGKKTDVKDSTWLAELLRHGLLKGSFIPDKEYRQWRDLTNLRRQLIETIADYKRRTQKLFETSNIKVDSVLTDLFGKSGQNIMNLLISGEKITIETLKKCVKGRAREKIEELNLSLNGFFGEHHRFVLKNLLEIIEKLEEQIEKINERIKEVMEKEEDLINRLKAIPGIGEKNAQNILAEIGPDLKSFPSASHFVSWAGLCPGNNESAGKRKTGRSPVRKKPIKTILVEAAWAAVKKKNSYFREKYFKLKARRGPKKAIIAIAHRIAKAVFHIIKHGVSYNELGPDYLNEKHGQAKFKTLTKQAKSIGYTLIPDELIGRFEELLAQPEIIKV